MTDLIPRMKTDILKSIENWTNVVHFNNSFPINTAVKYASSHLVLFNEYKMEMIEYVKESLRYYCFIGN